jgi:beta-ketodecanoyl-[acyl-carrier-protein] synthase
MYQPAITGSGVYTPEDVITNEELVTAFNSHAERFNAENASAIAAGRVAAKAPSSTGFIVNASGIEQRHVMDKTGILDPDVMHPRLRARDDDEPGIMTEMALDAAFDMNVACSSATFGIQAAADMIRAGSVRRALVVSPEICSAHLEWRDRDCHFIFGDVCTALVMERAEDAQGAHFRVRSTRCATRFSNNIRNNDGFLRRTRDGHMADRRDMLFMQEGRKVFKDVLPLVSAHIAAHMADEAVDPARLRRLWLHQANKTMNDFIGRKVMGRTPTADEQPNILQDYANTSSAGSIIAFSKFSDDLKPGDTGLICSFGAGYSVGSVLVERG